LPILNVDLGKESKRRKKMQNDILIVSDCCGEMMTPICAEQGVCPRCGEHCEAEIEVWPIPEWGVDY